MLMGLVNTLFQTFQIFPISLRVNVKFLLKNYKALNSFAIPLLFIFLTSFFLVLPHTTAILKILFIDLIRHFFKARSLYLLLVEFLHSLLTVLFPSGFELKIYCLERTFSVYLNKIAVPP